MQTKTLATENTSKQFTIDDWLANYEGRTEIAQQAMESVREVNGGDYIPWAMMWKVLMVLDPDAVVEKVENENGGYVFVDEHVLTSYVNKTSVDSNGEVVEELSETRVPSLSYYVKIKLTFHGKEYMEIMPVMASNVRRGTITKTFDNMAVHKALQRGTAKVISMATGVGLSLWTREEFEEEEAETKSSIIPEKKDPSKEKKKQEDVLEKKRKEIVKEIKKVQGDNPSIDITKKAEIEEGEPKAPKLEAVQPDKAEEVDMENPVKKEIIDVITNNRGNKALETAIKSFNIVLKLKGAEIDVKNDDEATLSAKLDKLDNQSALLGSLKKGVGIE